MATYANHYLQIRSYRHDRKHTPSPGYQSQLGNISGSMRFLEKVSLVIWQWKFGVSYDKQTCGIIQALLWNSKKNVIDWLYRGGTNSLPEFALPYWKKSKDTLGRVFAKEVEPTATTKLYNTLMQIRTHEGLYKANA
jgi:hypothetical protein